MRGRTAAALLLVATVAGCGGQTADGGSGTTTLPRGTPTSGTPTSGTPTGTATTGTPTGPGGTTGGITRPASPPTDPATAGGAPSAPDDATPGPVGLLGEDDLPDLPGYRYVRLRSDSVPDRVRPLGLLVSGFVSRGVAPAAGSSAVAEVEVFRLTAAGRTAARDTALLRQALGAFVPGGTPRTEQAAGTDVLVVDRSGGRPAGAAAVAGGDVVVVLAPSGADVARRVAAAYVAAS